MANPYSSSPTSVEVGFLEGNAFSEFEVSRQGSEVDGENPGGPHEEGGWQGEGQRCGRERGEALTAFTASGPCDPTQGSHNHLHLSVLCMFSCSRPNQMHPTHSALFLVQLLIVEQSGLTVSPLLPYACLILSLHRIKLIIFIAGQPASKEDCRNVWELTCVKSA